MVWAQDTRNSGIVSIGLQPASRDVLVPVISATPALLRLDPDATYVLAGGLGSLGLRIAETMAQHGATCLVFLSRSGGNRYADRLRNLNSRGCNKMVLKMRHYFSRRYAAYYS